MPVVRRYTQQESATFRNWPCSLEYLTVFYTIALQTAPSLVHAHNVPLAKDISSTKYLQKYHPDRSPEEILRLLAAECEHRNISTFDIYGDFDVENPNTSYLRQFETEIAQELGKEDAVFMPSGVMAQSIALLVHHNNHCKTKNKPATAVRRFACHYTSHLLLHEEEGFHELCNMYPVILPLEYRKSPIVFGTGRYDCEYIGVHSPPLLYSHVQRAAESHSELWKDEVSSLILELPHREVGGKLTPWEDILQLNQLLKEYGVALHCDGARLFEATVGYCDDDGDGPQTLAELVAPFDSVYISFYKGLGGLSGAMLLGNAQFCQQARIWLRRFGGNLHTSLPYAISGWAGYRMYWVQAEKQKPRSQLKQEDINNSDGCHYLTFRQKKDKLKRIVKAISCSPLFLAAKTSNTSIILFDPPIPEVNMVHIYLRSSMEDCISARDEIQKRLGVCIFHRIRELNASSTIDERAVHFGYRCRLELTIGEANGRIDDDIFVNSWVEFCKSLLGKAKSN